MANILARQRPDNLWYWYSTGPNGEELMRSNVGRRDRAGIELDLRVLQLLVAKPGIVAVEVRQTTRLGDWRSHLSVIGESEYEATSTDWHGRRCDAQTAAELTVAALR
jgi:hypothetical protein